MSNSNTAIPSSPAPASIAPAYAPPGTPDDALGSLRAELEAGAGGPRRARVLAEIAEIEERRGEDSAAMHDYLAAYESDATFREPLEGIARLLQNRSSLRGVAGRFFEDLVESSAAPDERVRALLMHAAHCADVTRDTAAAAVLAREATLTEGAGAAETARAWLELELLAGQSGDAAVREEALGERTRFATHPTWKALLLIDRARLASQAGDTESALALLDQALAVKTGASWTAANLLERIAQDRPGIAGTPEAGARAGLHAAALEAVADLVHQAIADPRRGDVLGVPRWARDPGRAVDAWIRAAEARRLLGQGEAAAATLDRAQAMTDRMTGDDARLAQAAVARARIRSAEQAGDTVLSAQIAGQWLATEKDPLLAAALALRVAEHAASQGDVDGAAQALSRALDSDPACLPANALLLDLLADGDRAPAFASRLEAFADHLASDEARARTLLLSAYVWGARAGDVRGAKAALARAAKAGASGEATARMARMLASLREDRAWYEDATNELLASGPEESEAISLHAEIIRLRSAAGDAPGAEAAIRRLGEASGGAWLSRVLEAFGPAAVVAADAPAESRARAFAAVEALADDEPEPELARTLRLMAAMRSQALGSVAAARGNLQKITERGSDDVIASAYLADLERAAGDHAAAARTSASAARATSDGELAAALHLEAAFEYWREGERAGAVDEMEAALAKAPRAAEAALRWACWGVDPDSLDARRRAIRCAADSGSDPHVLALEHFAVELGAGDPDAADAALAIAEASPAASLSLAAALGRIVWPAGGVPESAATGALSRIAARGPRALLLAATQRVRMAREAEDPEAIAEAARAWFDAGGGLPAALEWLAAAMVLGDSREEVRSWLAAADSLSGDARESMLAEAALLQTHIDLNTPAALIPGRSPAVRLANLELAPPGCDPRRRAEVLDGLGDVLGEDAALDAAALSGWSHLVSSDLEKARSAFERVTSARPNDIASWEGLRTSAERSGDSALRARAAAELGARCADRRRGAAFWEQAALLWIDLGDDRAADLALEASFARDPGRPVAFDRLFRRTRARKDNDKLLAVIARRLEVTDEPAEIQKLCWEQARALRETGDYDAALRSLEHVTILDPDHVGALALLGEINIRRSRFGEAAEALARLAALETAPPKNRVTAGVAAADLYENKLSRSDLALEVLLPLHHAKLSTAPVRERLARVAARTGAWGLATEALEELMNERPERAGRIEAARLVVVIHRDRLGDLQGAAPAVAKLISESPADGEAIDLLLRMDRPGAERRPLLEAARDALVHGMQTEGFDASAVRRLAEVARALDDSAREQAALGVLASLGASDDDAERAFAQLAAKKPRIPQGTLPGAALRSILAPGDQGPLADLFVLLGPTLAEALGPNARVCGVGRRDRIDPRSGLALRNEIASWAVALGIGQIDVYVGGKDALGVQGIATETPAIVVGAGVNAPLSPLMRARIVRELFAVARGTAVVRWRDEETVAAIVAAACRLADVPVEHPPYAMLDEIEKLVSKSISRKTRKLLAGSCGPIATGKLDAREWCRRALASQDRIAAAASGDPSLVLSDVLGVPIERLGQSVSASPRALELLRFVVSPAYPDVRRALGLEGVA